MISVVSLSSTTLEFRITFGMCPQGRYGWRVRSEVKDGIEECFNELLSNSVKVIVKPSYQDLLVVLNEYITCALKTYHRLYRFSP